MAVGSRAAAPQKAAGAQSIRRAAEVLRLVAGFAGRGASLTEVIKASGPETRHCRCVKRRRAQFSRGRAAPGCMQAMPRSNPANQ